MHVIVHNDVAVGTQSSGFLLLTLGQVYDKIIK